MNTMKIYNPQFFCYTPTEDYLLLITIFQLYRSNTKLSKTEMYNRLNIMLLDIRKIIGQEAKNLIITYQMTCGGNN